MWLASPSTMSRVVLWFSISSALSIACQRVTVNGDAQADAQAPVDGSPTSTDGTDGPPACAADASGPLSTSDPPRQTVPWTLVPATDGGMPGSDAGPSQDGGGAPGCVSSRPTSPFSPLPPTRDDVTCTGAVTTRRAGTTLELTLADGSILRWQPSSNGPSITPPALADGQTAWVDYSRAVTIVCPFCGSYETRRLQIRAGAAGPLIWIGRQGASLPDVEPALLQELFGIGARVEGTCLEAFHAGCWNVTRQVFDHVLLTTPEQLVPRAAPAHVTTPRGGFDVFWTYSSTETVMFEKNCNDGPDFASDTGFAASRTAP